jgi:protein-tyrosine phosphatase
VNDPLADQEFNEILPRLFLGGTPPTRDFQVNSSPASSAFDGIDLVCTFHKYSTPVIGETIELRYFFEDDWNYGLKAESFAKIDEIASYAHTQWQAGKSVLLRCQGGRNRSGLVMGVVLLHAGYSADDAIALMRERRDESVLFNEHFVAALREWVSPVK